MDVVRLAGRTMEHYLAALDRDGQPTAYLYECLVCGTHLAYPDFT
ncbi:CbrC family protein [Spirillospora sp. NPDC050679]